MTFFQSDLIELMKENKKSLLLSELLRNNHDDIARIWAKKVQILFRTHYKQYHLEDITTWAANTLAAIIENLETDTNQATKKYSDELTSDRLQAGFLIYEITEGLLLSKEVVLPLIHSSYPPGSPNIEEAITTFDKCLRLLISQFEKQYSEAMHQQLLDATELRLAESESIQRTTTALLQKLMLDEVLEIVCTEAIKLTGATGSAVLLIEDEGWLQVSISTGNPLPSLDRIPIEGSLAGKAVEDGIPILINEPDYHIQAYHRNSDFPPLLVVPLRVQDTNIGVIDVVNKQSGFNDDDIRIMGLFADQAAIAIEKATLHQQTEALAIIEERQRLARELHDSVTQSLYSVTLYADAARRALSSRQYDIVSENVMELRNMAQEAMLDMRLLIFELHPPILEKEGLVVAIQTRLESVEVRSGIHADFKVEGERRLPLDVETELYRIAQESLTNVVKHARAQCVSVELLYNDVQCRMKIWDNGIGFDPTSAAQEGGMGLRGIEARVKRIGGKFFIDSSRDDGTTIIVEVKR